MRTLLVPDVHEAIDKLDLLNDRIVNAERVVFLGDWFDSWGKRAPLLICEKIKYYQKFDHIEFLLGNHDCSYFFKHPSFRCSGYDGIEQIVIDENLDQAARARFKIFTKVGKFTVSHAGFHESTLCFRYPEVEADALKHALNGGYGKIWEAGRGRGGMSPVGGPTWLDWWWEFEDIEGIPQIVGHTVEEIVRPKGESWCIDDGLRSVCWVDEMDEVTFELI